MEKRGSLRERLGHRNAANQYGVENTPDSKVNTDKKTNSESIVDDKKNAPIKELSTKENVTSEKKKIKKKNGYIWVTILIIAICIGSAYKYFSTWSDKSKTYNTFNTSNFITYGKADNSNGYISSIDAKSGFRFFINKDNTTTAKLSIKYKSDIRCGILKVNDEIQNLYFPSTNWKWGHKDVVVQLQQGENKIEFCGGWQTDYAPDIAEIKVIAANNVKLDDIVGVWKGNYNEKGYNGGKGTLTMTINDDMTGVVEFVIKRQTVKLEGSYSVLVTYQNNVYSVTGKEFIKTTNITNYVFDSFNGTVNNGIYSGSNFNFKKTSIASPTPSSKNIEQKDKK